MNNELIKVGNIAEIPAVLEISRGDTHIIDSIMLPVIMSAKISEEIKSLPKELFGCVEGLKIYYNLFSLLDIVDTYRSKNHRWDEQDKKGLESTKDMLETLRADLQERLKIEIPRIQYSKKLKMINYEKNCY